MDASFSFQVKYSNVWFGSTEFLFWFIQKLILRSTCSIDIHLFPFDKQKCELRFRVAEYEANMINFRDACTFDNSYIEGL